MNHFNASMIRSLTCLNVRESMVWSGLIVYYLYIIKEHCLHVCDVFVSPTQVSLAFFLIKAGNIKDLLLFLISDHQL